MKFAKRPSDWARFLLPTPVLSSTLFLPKTDLLRQFPELGRTVPEYGNPAVRELFYRHYRIFYFVAADGGRVSLTSVQSSRYPLQPL